MKPILTIYVVDNYLHFESYSNGLGVELQLEPGSISGGLKCLGLEISRETLSELMRFISLLVDEGPTLGVH